MIAQCHQIFQKQTIPPDAQLHGAIANCADPSVFAVDTTSPTWLTSWSLTLSLILRPLFCRCLPRAHRPRKIVCSR